MVLRSDRLGDLVLCSGYLSNLVESCSADEVDLWVAPDMVPVRTILHPKLSVRSLPFDRYLRAEDKTLSDWLQHVEEQRYDRLIIPQFTLGYPEVLALERLSIPRRSGFANYELGVNPGWISLHAGAPAREQTLWITEGPGVEPFSHECEKYEALAASQGLTPERSRPRLSVPGLDRVSAVRDLLVWPGCGEEARRWPLGSFSETISKLGLAEAAIGATPSESALAQELQDLLREAGVRADIEIRQPAELAATAEWMAGFRRVLTNDTGTAHLAAACGRAAVSISHSQHQGRFAVCGDSALTIFADVPCSRCRKQCLFDETVWPCVSQIDAERAAEAIRKFSGGESSVFLAPKSFPSGSDLFARLHSAGLGRSADWEEGTLESTRAMESLRGALRESESERDRWRSLRREEEAQRDGLQAALAETERQSKEWESKCREFCAPFPWAAGSAPGDAVGQWPWISIITPSLQQGRFIEENIKSVLDQRYPNFEHIVVDAGSSDQTVSILNKYPHLRWVSEPDRGQAHAIDKGILMSRGDIVAYLNSDDAYLPGAFQAVAQAFLDNPAVRMVVGDCDYINEASEVVGHLKARYRRFEDLVRYWGWDKWYCLPQQSVFLRRDLLSEAGLFDIQYDMVLDYDMWLRIVQITTPHMIPQTLAAFRLASETKTVSRTHLMYLEELHASRRYWKLLPRGRRIVVALQAHRHVSRKLLDVAEHLAFSSQQPALAARLTLDSASKWPPVVFSPRYLLTWLQLGAQRLRPLCAGIRIVHRQYLALEWKLRNLAARRPSP